ncbi:MAG: hypothetical protein GEV10_16900 [Streptosporangiales bacterium]|nr:hypothetical protein [Streptosporangiales bacterium]
MLDAALRTELDSVPEFAMFATVDELSAEFERLARTYRSTCQLRYIGVSRLGEPLTCLTVGDGDRHAIVFAMPHPHEPVGGLTAVHLARRLCADPRLRNRLGMTWHILPCVDPDGTRLNEGWLHGPFTRTHYANNFYRPSPDEQVDWTFPFAYKQAYFDGVLPETAALMRLIDGLRPAFMCSLHNAEVGGVYYYLSRHEPGLYPALQEIPQHLGIPLDLGEPEQPHIELLSKAVFRTANPRSAYDAAEQYGLDPLHGGSGESSAGYALRYGTLSLITEVPYWTHPNVNDRSPSDTRYADALREQGKALGQFADQLCDVLRLVGAELATNSPFLRATRTFTAHSSGRMRDIELRAERPDADRPATSAELHSLRDTVHTFRLRYSGMLLRALDGELAIGNGTPTIRAQRAVVAEAHAQWCETAEQESAAEQIPIRNQVATQYGAILASAERVTRR